jgi:hypothetical protein
MKILELPKVHLEFSRLHPFLFGNPQYLLVIDIKVGKKGINWLARNLSGGAGAKEVTALSQSRGPNDGLLGPD